MRISDPAVIERLADLVLANRREREMHRLPEDSARPCRTAVISANGARNDGDHQAGNLVVAEGSGSARASSTA